MMRRLSAIILALAAIMGPPLAAQGILGVPLLPSLPTTAIDLDAPLHTPVDLLNGTTREITTALRDARRTRLDALVSRNRASIEMDAAGEPARRGVLLLIDPDEETSAAVNALGFAIGPRQQVDGLDITVSEITLPPGMSVAKAQRLLQKKVPDAAVTSDQLHFQSASRAIASVAAGAAGPALAPVGVPVGIIDGGAAQSVAATRGFARGAPIPSNHGSAVVSLAMGAGARRVLVADVYGTDPAGGSSLAVSNALGWLVSSGAKVISVSLVGPRNALVERAVRAARARGVVIVAAVGNDGAAAPPSFPASYPGVLAITAVDARNRVLIEAGRAAHVDYAAPGAGLFAYDRAGRRVAVRGTSYAAPLVAMRAAAAFARGVPSGQIVAALDAEAIPLSKRRPDPKTGRGLICSICR